METKTLTHWKKAFKSDYLSSSDIDEKQLVLIIDRVVYKECVLSDGKKFKNVAIFKDTVLDSKGNYSSGTKPMVLNVGNSKIVKKFSGNKVHLEEWLNIPICVYVDPNTKFGKETVEGLRIRETQPQLTKQTLTDTMPAWNKAIDIYKAEKSLAKVETYYTITEDDKNRIISLANGN